MWRSSKRWAISTVAAELFIIAIVLAAAIVTYFWLTGALGGYTSTSSAVEVLQIESYVVEGTTLTVYVRNVGSASATIDAAYLESHGDTYKLEQATSPCQSAVDIWGGDEWEVDPTTLETTRTKSGKIIQDVFTSQNTSVWDDSYVDYNNDWSAVYYDPDGLKLLSESAGGWAVRGLITQQRVVDLSSLPVVIEVDLQKTNYHVPDGDAAASPFAACLYLSSSRKQNPYYATPWFAAKLYPRYSPSRTEAQLVVRSTTIDLQTLYTWDSAPNSQPRGVFLLIFDEQGKVRYWFWEGDRSGAPDESGEWSSPQLSDVYGSGPLYLYLTIDNSVTVSSRKVHVRYLQVYSGYSITVSGVKPGWTVQLVDQSGSVLFEEVATDSTVTIDLLDYIVSHGMPVRGCVKVLTYSAEELREHGGTTLSPGEVKALVFSIQEVPRGEYVLKLVTKSGYQCVSNVAI